MLPSSGMDSILTIDHLVKKYGAATAVNDISLKVARGSFFGFLGPNGAGKSTTINCIIGVGRITSGNIVVNGHDVVTDYREARRQIGVSPQEFNTDFFGKPEDIIEAMAGYHGIPKKIRKERTDELIEKFELTAHRSKKFNELSGGLKRRVILARALVTNPELLILDEPTAGVDVEQRHSLWKYFKELNEAGKTIILTSHYLEEVELLCNEIAIINGGKIVAQGSKDSFIKDGHTLEEKYLSITKGESY